ncbi:TPA: hypothetical protein ACGCAJ_004754 [Serratia marcescens]
MMTITAHAMYLKSAEAHLTDAEVVRNAVEARIKRAADAGLTVTTTSLVVDGKVPTDICRATVLEWLDEAGFTVRSDMDMHPGCVEIRWGRK